MRLDISRLLKEPGSSMPFEFRETLENLNLGGERMDFDEPVHVQGVCQYTGKSFLTEGSIKARYTATCSRCTADMHASLDIPFQAVYTRGARDEGSESYPLEGNVIELTSAVADELLLNIPMRHLCSPDCQGLCPVCGADRNRTQCGCGDRNEYDDSFARLLKITGESEGTDKEE
ncbi:MAG: DUF177 domain-containing protein [Clostridiales bacterium]|nr:DUF177 domain-containing protein [Clostridiales bacterium]